MKPTIVLSAAILIGALIVANALGKLQQTVATQGSGNRNYSNFPSHLTVEAPPSGFRVSGDILRVVEQRPSSASSGNPGTAEEAFSQVTNVRLVESLITPAQLAAAPQLLPGRWRDENSYAEYRADGTCTWTRDNDTARTSQWRIEGDTIFVTAGASKTHLRILELDEHHFVYQQFPTGSVWRAARLPDTAPVELDR